MNKTKNNIGNIYLIWRKSRGERRTIVGVIRRNATSGVCFKYTISAKEAKEIGFVPYTDFPELDKVYTQNVLDVIGLRLNNPERPDIQQYYDFWQIDKAHQEDKYFILAHTQGLLATDNFEFLADYNPSHDLSFISEICGLSHSQLPSDTLTVGEELKWKREPDNKWDKNAISLYKGDICLGYVKIVHSRVFSKRGASSIRVTVKSIEANGHLNRVFIKISTK